MAEHAGGHSFHLQQQRKEKLPATPHQAANSFTLLLSTVAALESEVGGKPEPQSSNTNLSIRLGQKAHVQIIQNSMHPSRVKQFLTALQKGH